MLSRITPGDRRFLLICVGVIIGVLIGLAFLA